VVTTLADDFRTTMYDWDPIVGVGVLCVILILTAAMYFVQGNATASFSNTSKNSKSRTAAWRPAKGATATAAGTGTTKEPKVTTLSPTGGPGDVWEDRRRKGIVASVVSSSSSKLAEMEKPFGSSYYYAHNNSNAKGGYTDGLSIEDYTMNGPRLLSRGGRPLAQAPLRVEAMPPSTCPETDLGTDVPKKPSIERRTQHISRYLWDDPGDGAGIAIIRIDELPGKGSSETVPWKDANVSDWTAKLIGDGGLLLSGINQSEMIEYRLHIKQLYGSASNVEVVVKAKRLLVRIYKKKDKTNMKAWPHPQKKLSRSHNDCQ
jgi:hypothetical protein